MSLELPAMFFLTCGVECYPYQQPAKSRNRDIFFWQAHLHFGNIPRAAQNLLAKASFSLPWTSNDPNHGLEISSPVAMVMDNSGQCLAKLVEETHRRKPVTSSILWHIMARSLDSVATLGLRSRDRLNCIIQALA